MNSLNRDILAGRLLKDPDIRYSEKEEAVAYFTIAINRSAKTELIKCIARGGLAKIVGEFLKKGKLVAMEGKLCVKSCQSMTEIEVENLQMLDSKFYQAAEKAK